MTFFSLLILFVTSLSIASEDQNLNGKWSYYGEEFYQTLSARRAMDKRILISILNESHESVRGRLDIIGQCRNQGSCYRHNVVGYESARKIMFGELDTRRDGRGTFVLDVYCGKKFYFRSLNDVSRMHTEVNIEHTWPQSKFSRRFPKEMQKSDMHHLYLTDSRANSIRGNSPFGIVDNQEDRMGGEGCNQSRVGIIYGQDVYTPPVPHRGNVARALFYFSAHYNMPIERREEIILRQWHKADPVDAAEVKRHALISRHQKVRNPFIDHPEIVDRINDF